MLIMEIKIKISIFSLPKFQADASLIRAKMQLVFYYLKVQSQWGSCCLWWRYKSYPTYGPVYRELAETYYY
jgi:hypothetical protein